MPSRLRHLTNRTRTSKVFQKYTFHYNMPVNKLFSVHCLSSEMRFYSFRIVRVLYSRNSLENVTILNSYADQMSSSFAKKISSAVIATATSVLAFLLLLCVVGSLVWLKRRKNHGMLTPFF